jgi:hypothetical protein
MPRFQRLALVATGSYVDLTHPAARNMLAHLSLLKVTVFVSTARIGEFL